MAAGTLRTEVTTLVTLHNASFLRVSGSVSLESNQPSFHCMRLPPPSRLFRLQLEKNMARGGKTWYTIA